MVIVLLVTVQLERILGIRIDGVDGSTGEDKMEGEEEKQKRRKGEKGKMLGRRDFHCSLLTQSHFHASPHIIFT